MSLTNHFFARFIKKHDPILLISVLLISAFGLVTMNTFTGIDNAFFIRQSVWILIGLTTYFVVSLFDVRFLRRTTNITILYGASILLLLAVLLFADPVQGARSWFALGPVAIQPSDPIKLVVIALLAKYFSRRHMEIANIRHILISGAYTFVIFVLVLLQPDFGTAVIIGLLWLFMVVVSGISKKHLALVSVLAVVGAGFLWLAVFDDFQRDRVMTFIHPLTDIQGAGYNAYQSRIAIGSGQIVGKGIGYGTQSKLQFLPEYETDFIFAAYAEEWGFVGVLVLLSLYGIIILRLLSFAWRAPTNFESLFAIGVGSLFISHILIHVGGNLGLLPVTGTTIPFMSYGGSHLLTEFIALGLIASMRLHAYSAHRKDLTDEVV